MKLNSIITCPKCGASREEIMPADRCLVTYTCTSCGEVLKPENGDCCVFCSFGTNPCPPMQVETTSAVNFTLNPVQYNIQEK